MEKIQTPITKAFLLSKGFKSVKGKTACYRLSKYDTTCYPQAVVYDIKIYFSENGMPLKTNIKAHKSYPYHHICELNVAFAHVEELANGLRVCGLDDIANQLEQ